MLYVIEVPYTGKPYIWTAVTKDDFYNIVQRDLAHHDRIIYHKTRPRYEWEVIYREDMSYEDFLRFHNIPCDYSIYSHVWRADYINDGIFYYTRDPGKLEAYTAACFHDLYQGFLFDGTDKLRSFIEKHPHFESIAMEYL